MATATTPLTRLELAQQYDDPDWQAKLLDLLSLVAILRESVIHKTYKPSEDLNAAIALSEAGKRVSTRLATQEKVNPKDARLLALLGLVHIEPLVDVASIDMKKLELAISEEIKSGALIFPMIFGRDLYDKAVTLFAEERDYLNHDDTLRLLEGADQGVFQAGYYLLGPFGIHKRSFTRRIPPTTSIPLQHCSDTACSVVHRVQLTTSIEAGVNRSRPALTKVLDAISEEPSEWNGYVSDITEGSTNSFDISESSAIEYLLGDAFSTTELRSLSLHAVSNTGGEFQRAATDIGLTGKPKDYLEALTRAQLLQLLLMMNNVVLAALLDSAVRDGIIIVPGDEVRRPKVNRAARSGSWSLRPQLSRLGVRAVSVDPDLPLLRLSALTQTLFDSKSTDDMSELAWILRGTRGETPEEQLAEFLRTSDPGLVIDTLVLARRTNALQICETLGIEIAQENHALRDSILWKLGFPLPRSQDIRDEYWRLHATLESLAKTAAVDLTSTAEGLRQAAADYFVSLERFLFDSLIFATWGLLQDHYISNNPFTYFQTQATTFAVESLNAASEEDGARGTLSTEPVLSAIVDGFVRLSKLLSVSSASEGSLMRDSASYPKYSKKTDLQQFPFVHVQPFLDLLPDSQKQIIATLATVGSELNDSGIMTARNGLLHAKQRIPTVAEVEDALRKSRTALDRLESIGCVRSTYNVSSSLINAWGGATIVLSSNGKTISFSSPSPYEWTKMPELTRPHYLMQGAVFARPNEMLRFAEGFDSDYQEYWSGFPRRPEPGNRIVSSQSESLATSSETGSYSATRAG